MRDVGIIKVAHKVLGKVNELVAQEAVNVDLGLFVVAHVLADDDGDQVNNKFCPVYSRAKKRKAVRRGVAPGSGAQGQLCGAATPAPLSFSVPPSHLVPVAA